MGPGGQDGSWAGLGWAGGAGMGSGEASTARTAAIFPSTPLVGRAGAPPGGGGGGGGGERRSCATGPKSAGALCCAPPAASRYWDPGRRDGGDGGRGCSAWGGGVRGMRDGGKGRRAMDGAAGDCESRGLGAGQVNSGWMEQQAKSVLTEG